MNKQLNHKDTKTQSFTKTLCALVSLSLRSFTKPAKLLFAFLFFSVIASSQEVRLTFDKQKILLGEQILMKMEATVNEGDNTSFFLMDSLPHFEVLDRSKIDTNVVNGKLQLSQTLLITSWDSGRWMMPTSIIVGTPSKPVYIDVAYTTPWNPKQPYNDIKGIIPVKPSGGTSWWWYVIGSAVLLALFLLFFPELKREKLPERLDASAYKKALLQLEKLQKDGSVSANPKQFYTELINIFRGYLRNGKGIHSFSKTTDDLSVQLKDVKLPSSDYNELVQTLRLSDLAKFAQYRPEAALVNESFNTIRQSITTIQSTHVV